MAPDLDDQDRYVFAVLHVGGGMSGSYVRIRGTIFSSHQFAEMARRGECANVVLIRAHYATGNGLSIGLATTDEFYHQYGGGYFLPARITRGARGATEEELAAVPDYIARAYHWYLAGA